MPNPKDFATSWASAWNAHDIDEILSHYTDDIVFRSRKAIPILGEGLIDGKATLRRYWSIALSNQPDLHFTVQTVFEGHDMLVISYSNHLDVSAAETLHFDQAGLVWQASACHAAS